jgi:hypothetical protein
MFLSLILIISNCINTKKTVHLLENYYKLVIANALNGQWKICRRPQQTTFSVNYNVNLLFLKKLYTGEKKCHW